MSNAAVQDRGNWRHVEERLTAQRKRVASLMRSDALTGGDVHAAVRQVTEVAAELLDLARASVWRFDEPRRSLDCLNLFTAPTREHTSGLALDGAQYPAYFRALTEERAVAADDAPADPRTCELAGYLQRERIGALLAAPIFFRGELHGVVCGEHVGGGRKWQLWEELLMGTLADFVAMVLEAADRVERQGELRRYREELENRVEQRTVELEARNEDLHREVAERQRAEAQLREMATRDPLTDAINRRHFFELAEQELHRARRYARPLSLAMVDADHFKGINDQHGHLVGDQVLRMLVELCRSSLRRTDVLARYGGEELVILLPETALPAAAAVVERVREAVERQVVQTREAPVRFTVSAGVVSVSAGEAASVESIESLLRRADEALYAAKNAGRNRVVAVEAPRARAAG